MLRERKSFILPRVRILIRSRAHGIKHESIGNKIVKKNVQFGRRTNKQNSRHTIQYAQTKRKDRLRMKICYNIAINARYKLDCRDKFRNKRRTYIYTNTRREFLRTYRNIRTTALLNCTLKLHVRVSIQKNTMFYLKTTACRIRKL